MKLTTSLRLADFGRNALAPWANALCAMAFWASAVARLVPESPADLTELTGPRIERALDLLGIEEMSIPFDAQTKFYRLMTSGDPLATTRLKSLAVRMGFSRDAFDNGIDR